MPTAEPICPRCGYDLSAESRKWTHACPLDGACWECGLRLEWADLFSPDRRRDVFFVEHAPERHEVLPAAWRTWWWAIRPPVFWSRIRLETAIVPRRIAWWVFCVLLAFHAFCALASNAILGKLRGWDLFLPFRDDIRAETFTAWLAPVGCLIADWRGTTIWGYRFAPAWEFTSWGPAYLPLLAMSLMLPIMLLVLKDTRAKARVRRAHILRAAVFGLAWLVPLMLLALAHFAFNQWAASSNRTNLLYFQIGPKWLALESIWGFALVPFGAAWILWWWWSALSRGWRLDEHGRVWLAASAPALLVVVIVLALDQDLVNLLA
ncbi:hypothetical protein PHYC_01175 [Phycisphaerales bacterium]|nr:hypothetical protein PHYC_01175 [Phycisphaerales bacterium]